MASISSSLPIAYPQVEQGSFEEKTLRLRGLSLKNYSELVDKVLHLFEEGTKQTLCLTYREREFIAYLSEKRGCVKRLEGGGKREHSIMQKKLYLLVSSNLGDRYEHLLYPHKTFVEKKLNFLPGTTFSILAKNKFPVDYRYKFFILEGSEKGCLERLFMRTYTPLKTLAEGPKLSPKERVAISGTLTRYYHESSSKNLLNVRLTPDTLSCKLDKGSGSWLVSPCELQLATNDPLHIHNLFPSLSTDDPLYPHELFQEEFLSDLLKKQGIPHQVTDAADLLCRKKLLGKQLKEDRSLDICYRAFQRRYWRKVQSLVCTQLFTTVAYILAGAPPFRKKVPELEAFTLPEEESSSVFPFSTSFSDDFLRNCAQRYGGRQTIEITHFLSDVVSTSEEVFIPPKDWWLRWKSLSSIISNTSSPSSSLIKLSIYSSFSAIETLAEFHLKKLSETERRIGTTFSLLLQDFPMQYFTSSDSTIACLDKRDFYIQGGYKRVYKVYALRGERSLALIYPRTLQKRDLDFLEREYVVCKRLVERRQSAKKRIKAFPSKVPYRLEKEGQLEGLIMPFYPHTVADASILSCDQASCTELSLHLLYAYNEMCAMKLVNTDHKPENILVQKMDKGFKIRLTDFSDCFSYEELDLFRIADFVCTPDYLSEKSNDVLHWLDEELKNESFLGPYFNRIRKLLSQGLRDKARSEQEKFFLKLEATPKVKKNYESYKKKYWALYEKQFSFAQATTMAILLTGLFPYEVIERTPVLEYRESAYLPVSTFLCEDFIKQCKDLTKGKEGAWEKMLKLFLFLNQTLHPDPQRRLLIEEATESWEEICEDWKDL